MPTEHEEQATLIEWFDLWAPPHLKGRLAAVPNGGLRSARTAGMLKAEGVRAGYLDLQLLFPRGPYHGLIIEMKRVRLSVVSAEQAAWMAWHLSCGYWSVICRGASEAQKVIEQYLALGPFSPR